MLYQSTRRWLKAYCIAVGSCRVPVGLDKCQIYHTVFKTLLVVPAAEGERSLTLDASVVFFRSVLAKFALVLEVDMIDGRVTSRVRCGRKWCAPIASLELLEGPRLIAEGIRELAYHVITW